MIGEKPLNVQVKYFLKKKPRENQAKKRSRTFLLT